MIDRREFLARVALLAGGSLLAANTELSAAERAAVATAAPRKPRKGQSYNAVVTPNGAMLPWRMERGVKVFHLVAEPVKHEFAPGMVGNCWGYNGRTPGPTIEAVEGDRVRILVTNKLPEATSIHWHGMIIPNGMDGVAGLNQPAIPPGETWVYEFPLKTSGSFMYHPHSDETLQLALGMMGMFVVHPRDGSRRVDRDYCIMLHEWAVEPGSATPNPAVMTDFNLFTFNSRAFPGTDPLPVRLGDRVRIRLGNLSMDSHPIHLHGHHFNLVGTDGGWLHPSAYQPMTTVNVPVGTVQVIEFIADNPGDWAFHCHKSHHTMNAMGHTVPNMLGVDQRGVAEKIQKLLPDYMYMPMGEKGMGDMAQMADMGMKLPDNTLPMMAGKGPFGPIEMGGMFTVVKIRKGLARGDYRDPGWYHYPPGSVAHPLKASNKPKTE